MSQAKRDKPNRRVPTGEFAAAWNAADSAREVAAKLGMRYGSCRVRAALIRRQKTARLKPMRMGGRPHGMAELVARHLAIGPGGCRFVLRGHLVVQRRAGKFELSRVCYAATVGPIRPDQCVRRTCRNPVCVTPEHLYAAPLPARPGGMAGPLNSRARLSPADVRAIRERHARGDITLVALGREWGVHPTYVGKLVRGVRYATA